MKQSPTRISVVIPTSCLVPVVAVSVALPAAAELGDVGQRIFAVDQPVAEDSCLIDPRVVRREGARVSPMPVE